MKAFSITLIIAFALFFQTTEAAEYLREGVAKDYDENLEEIYLHFHRNPELSNLESETAKRLAAEITALGYEVTEGVGGTGIVAVMKNGPGPTVMIRADMDGLPVKEQSGLDYASTATQNGIAFPLVLCQRIQSSRLLSSWLFCLTCHSSHIFLVLPFLSVHVAYSFGFIYDWSW